MLFKYPQLLWSLWLLLIPILIHLLQLRRFRTTPFTNVRLLKRVQAKSQKSQSLKRWLLLLTRMALFAALILAFAQPFTAEKTAFREQQLVIYLDNSFSMQARLEQGSLLEEATQELINSIPEEVPFSLFTNDSEYRDVTMAEIRNSLLELKYAPDQLTLEEIRLKGNSYFRPDTDALRRLVILSDFQAILGSDEEMDGTGSDTYLVPIRSEEVVNISIDSVILDSGTGAENNLLIHISGNTDFGSTPVSLYNKGSLIAKSAVTYTSDNPSELIFTLPGGEKIEGRISLTDAGLAYDNELYFNLNTREKIKVIGVGAESGWLVRLFRGDITEYRAVETLDGALALLPDQDLVILNGLRSLSASASDQIRDFVDQGGSLLLIPSPEMEAGDFNRLLTPYGLSLSQKNSFPLEITDINYAHPLFTGVFKEEVKNFLYPSVREYFSLNGRADQVLGYSNEEPFLASRGKIYVFTAPLERDNSNFTGSPLVVPTLFAMALQSRSLPTPYYLLGTESSADVPVQMGEDRILSLRKGELEFIPRQQAVGRKTRIWFSGTPQEAGTYTLENAAVERSFSFNFPRSESDLSYLDLDDISTEANVVSSISELFSEFEKDSAVTGLWKWFVILAVLFLLIEVIIQKAMK